MLAENIAISVSRFAVVTCEVESTDVSPPTADVAPALIVVGGVSFPGALRAPYDPFTASFVPAPVALFQQVAVLLHEVVVTTGVAGPDLVEISSSRGRIRRGGVRGCVHVIGRSNEGRFRNGG